MATDDTDRLLHVVFAGGEQTCWAVPGFAQGDMTRCGEPADRYEYRDAHAHLCRDHAPSLPQDWTAVDRVRRID